MAVVNVNASAGVYLASFDSGYWWNVASTLHISGEEKLKYCEVRGTKWPRDRPKSANIFHGTVDQGCPARTSM
jgi:hypothetical protein